MPTLPSSAFLTSSASICWAATLLADSGTGRGLPGTRPYHLLDFFFTFFAPGVPAFTLRDSTKRAPGASAAQGRPSGPIQHFLTQYWMTVILNTLLGMGPSFLLIAARPGQVQAQVGAQLIDRPQRQGAL